MTDSGEVRNETFYHETYLSAINISQKWSCRSYNEDLVYVDLHQDGVIKKEECEISRACHPTHFIRI